MKKWVLHYVLFIFLLLTGLIQTISGFLLWLVIPGGHRGFINLSGRVTQVLWSRYTWIELHDWTAVALAVLVIIHIVLHWKWIVQTTRKAIGVQSS
jgi:cytochrome b561